MLYTIEGAENGFTSIPRSIYWAIVTLTTVGFGDIAPQTGLGQALASDIMIVGYVIIAVPTGIVAYDMSQVFKDSENKNSICSNCKKRVTTATRFIVNIVVHRLANRLFRFKRTWLYAV